MRKTPRIITTTFHSLSKAFPLQEVLHSSIGDSAANYSLYHKLLDNCDVCLLSLPLFGGLLLSHTARMRMQMNDNYGMYLKTQAN